jgi:putative nucleotidyltransferase with HDIG domain
LTEYLITLPLSGQIAPRENFFLQGVMDSLKIKILGLTTAIMLLALGLTAWHNIETQKEMLERFVTQDGRILGETIRNSIISSMASGLNEEVAPRLEQISKDPAIQGVRIFDETGRILTSSDVNEIGSIVSASDLLAYRSGKHSYSTTLQGLETHTTLVPIHNAAKCYVCHDSKNRILGILDVHLSLAEMANIQSKGRHATLLSSFCALLILIISITIFILLYVDTPLRIMSLAMTSLEKGEFDMARIDIRSSREMANLSWKFNLMVEHLKYLLDQTICQEREMAIAEEKLTHHDELREMNMTLEERLKEIEYLNITLEERIEDIEDANYKIADLAGELEERNTILERAVTRLQALHKMGLSLNSTMDIDRLFNQLIRKTMETLRARVGYILLVDRDSRTLQLAGAYGLPLHTDDIFSHIPIRPGGCSHWVITNHQPLLISNIDDSREFNRVSLLGYSRETILCAPLTIQDEVIGTITMANKTDEGSFTSEDLELLTTIAAQASIAIKNARLYEEQEKSYLNTVQALVSAVEASDAYTCGHSERVTYYALKLARHIDLPSESLRTLEQAAILHDIGKIGICESLLHKAEALSREEIDTLHLHPGIGVKILEPISFLSDVRKIIHQHHERYDGSGYPHGIKKDQLLLEARILALADTYDAMTTDRPYRKALSHDVTIQEIRDNSGTQFDPELARSFIELFEDGSSA